MRKRADAAGLECGWATGCGRATGCGPFNAAQRPRERLATHNLPIPLLAAKRSSLQALLPLPGAPPTRPKRSLPANQRLASLPKGGNEAATADQRREGDNRSNRWNSSGTATNLIPVLVPLPITQAALASFCRPNRLRRLGKRLHA
jgi:hypothetical protein